MFILVSEIRLFHVPSHSQIWPLCGCNIICIFPSACNPSNHTDFSFHCGSGITDARIYTKNIATAKQVFDMAEKEGIRMNLLDLGGGFYGDSSAPQILKGVYMHI